MTPDLIQLNPQISEEALAEDIVIASMNLVDPAGKHISNLLNPYYAKQMARILYLGGYRKQTLQVKINEYKPKRKDKFGLKK